MDFVHSMGQRLNVRREEGIHWLGDGARRRRFGEGWRWEASASADEATVALRLLATATVSAPLALETVVEVEGPAIFSVAPLLVVGTGPTDSEKSSADCCAVLRKMHLFACRLRFEFTPNRLPQVSQTKAVTQSQRDKR